MSAVAGCLHTKCGPLYIYDVEAIIAIVGAINELGLEADSHDHGVDLVTKLDEAKSVLLDGFNIEEWASYAKKKASIASHMCSLNGAFKANLVEAQMPHRPADSGDPIFRADPWAGYQSSHRSGESTPSCEDAWSRWKRRTLVGNQTAVPEDRETNEKALGVQDVGTEPFQFETNNCRSRG